MKPTAFWNDFPTDDRVPIFSHRVIFAHSFVEHGGGGLPQFPVSSECQISLMGTLP